MKAKERVCVVCGTVDITASKATKCAKCTDSSRRESKRKEEKEFIENIGYTQVEFVGMNAHLKPEWKFTHDCGTRQTWTFNNLVKRVKADPNTIPCSVCGGVRRAKIATAVSAENRKIKNHETWPDYLAVVRRLTAGIYRQYKNEINPMDLRRSHRGYQLDHIMSIAEGYERGLAPEYIARRENLQMLPAAENKSKGRK